MQFYVEHVQEHEVADQYKKPKNTTIPITTNIQKAVSLLFPSKIDEASVTVSFANNLQLHHNQYTISGTVTSPILFTIHTFKDISFSSFSFNFDQGSLSLNGESEIFKGCGVFIPLQLVLSLEFNYAVSVIWNSKFEKNNTSIKLIQRQVFEITSENRFHLLKAYLFDILQVEEAGFCSRQQFEWCESQLQQLPLVENSCISPWEFMMMKFGDKFMIQTLLIKFPGYGMTMHKKRTMDYITLSARLANAKSFALKLCVTGEVVVLNKFRLKAIVQIDDQLFAISVSDTRNLSITELLEICPRDALVQKLDALIPTIFRKSACSFNGGKTVLKTTEHENSFRLECSSLDTLRVETYLLDPILMPNGVVLDITTTMFPRTSRVEISTQFYVKTGFSSAVIKFNGDKETGQFVASGEAVLHDIDFAKFLAFWKVQIPSKFESPIQKFKLSSLVFNMRNYKLIAKGSVTSSNITCRIEISYILRDAYVAIGELEEIKLEYMVNERFCNALGQNMLKAKRFKNVSISLLN